MTYTTIIRQDGKEFVGTATTAFRSALNAVKQVESKSKKIHASIAVLENDIELVRFHGMSVKSAWTELRWNLRRQMA